MYNREAAGGRPGGHANGRNTFCAPWQRSKEQGADETSESLQAEAQPEENSLEDHGRASLVRIRLIGAMRTELSELFSLAEDEASPRFRACGSSSSMARSAVAGADGLSGVSSTPHLRLNDISRSLSFLEGPLSHQEMKMKRGSAGL